MIDSEAQVPPRLELYKRWDAEPKTLGFHSCSVAQPGVKMYNMT